VKPVSSKAWEAKPLKSLNRPFGNDLSVKRHQFWRGLGGLGIVAFILATFLLIAEGFKALPSWSIRFFS